MTALARPPFDVRGYLADLRTAGIVAVKHNGVVFLRPEPPGIGFGEAYRLVHLRWSDAIRAGSIQAALAAVVSEGGTS